MIKDLRKLEEIQSIIEWASENPKATATAWEKSHGLYSKFFDILDDLYKLSLEPVDRSWDGMDPNYEVYDES